MIRRRYWKYIIYALMIFYVAYITSNLAFLNELIQKSHDYTIGMSGEIREIGARLAEMENILPGLLSSSDLGIEAIMAQLDRHDKTQIDALERLEKNFDDDPKIIKNLREAFQTLMQSRREAARRFENNLSYELAAIYFSNNLRPQINVITSILANVSASVEKHSDVIHAEIHSSAYLIIFFSLVFGLVITCITALYDRSGEKAYRDIAYRDELFRQLARNIDEVFIIAVNAKDFEYVGSNSERLISIPSKKLIDDPALLDDVLGPEDWTWFRNILDGAPLKAPVERDINSPGLDKFLKIRIYSIQVPSTRQERFIVVISDQTEIARHQEALSYALENAHAASIAKSSFLSHMSHEIRTPMNAIIGMTTIAISRIQDQARVRDCLGKIAESSRHLLGLINDVLDMSKIESGKLSISNEKFNLHHSIESIANIMRAQTNAKGQNFEILLENVDEEILIGDAMRLNQVLLNILSNASKFTPEGGHIILKLTQLEKRGRNTRIRFAISDTGIGMTQEFLRKIYTPFEQAAANTAAKYGGTGLGMPITANLVALMGGSINVQSKLGEGTVFFVDLPFELTGEAVWREGSLPSLRILIVDDDVGTCEHAALLLDKMGLAPVWTLNGSEAVEMVRKAHEEGRQYDVCLIDWRMPDMNGAETARAIREVAGDDMLIIIISAYDLEPIEAEARAAGVNDFIAKPFFASTLHDALVAATKRIGAEEEGALQKSKPTYDFTGKRILLVEDNDFNREIAQEFLEMVNVEVENAENGRQAVEKFTQSQPGYYDLALMDVQMPVMDGYEATRMIRASSHPQAATLPIVAMTANAFSEDVARAMAAGMNSHLAKPIDVEQLYKQIARYLGLDSRNA